MTTTSPDHGTAPARRTTPSLFSELMSWMGDQAPIGHDFRIEELHEGDRRIVRADLPGIDPAADLEVLLEDDVLTIRAHRREETESEDRHVHRTEVRYGSLERSVRVPPGTSVDDVTASYVDGVLTVSMPLPVPPAARRIPVDHPEPPGD
ncbi:Hsp20/alpha crystallin family protein [Nocardioides taihuensis]|uniref:Hsp20/alpha crystallin family protein n=1 Tax=Nocardioides taihuensis TaxID=1835606 RepID=A0ABW0BIZ9_9ACTN